MKPIVLAPNQPQKFYRGGHAIAEFRGTAVEDDHRPEDWLASITTEFGGDTDGLTVLPDGRRLRDAVAADPKAWLGPAHTARFGTDTALLVKLLDAGQRLPVHVHPDRGFARRHLGCRNGKTEAWIVVAVRGAGPCVHLGFTEDVAAADLDRWVSDSDTGAMLGRMHAVPVGPGDSVLVPAGTPHAIGEGVFCIELQEPTDFSIMMEWKDFGIDGPNEGNLGLGYDVALECVRRAALSPDELERLMTPSEHAGNSDGPVEHLLPPGAEPYFRAERVRPRRSVRLDPSFSVLVVTDGRGQLDTEHGGMIPLRRGQTVLVPYGSGAATVTGRLELVRCLPPAADFEADVADDVADDADTSTERHG
jgi:mannose-6-phosphate isomerase